MKNRYYIARFAPMFYFSNIERRYIQENSLKFNLQTARYLLILAALFMSFVITDLALFSLTESKLISVFSKAIVLIVAILCYRLIQLKPRSYARLFIASNISFILFISNIIIITGVYHKDPITSAPPTVYESIVPYLITMLLIGIMPSIKPSIQFSFLSILVTGYLIEVHLFYSFDSPLVGYSATYLFIMFIISTVVAFSLHRYKRLMWSRSHETRLLLRQINRQKNKLLILNRLLEHQSLIDDLTGISNRRAFNKELTIASDQYDRNNHQFSLFIIDIDHFKSVNDRYGHQVGDLLLRHIAGVLSQSVRSTDKLFRIGGEEFAVISYGASGDKNETLANRIQAELIHHSMEHEGHKLKITVSQGICSIFEVSRCPGDIFALADRALYRAKETRNCYEIINFENYDKNYS